MKNYLLLLTGIFLLGACHKNSIPASSDQQIVSHILSATLAPSDYAVADISSLQSSVLRNGHRFFRLKMGEEHIVLETDAAYQLLKGAIYQITGVRSKQDGHTTYSGMFRRSDLSRKNKVQWVIDKGFVKELHSFQNIVSNGTGQHVASAECSDCTLPEVIVSASYPSSGGIDWLTWMSLYSLFDMGATTDYLAIDWTAFGGGGGTAAPVTTIDQETVENKDKIDPKKYTDCFGTVPDNSTTLYTVTISTDLPVDGQPGVFFNWTDRSPGHAFIELNKSTPYGGVAQSFGFYPTSSYKLITLDNNVSLSSKLVDDGGHEYQARYTISVTAAQFQAAVNAVNNPRDLYNVGLYNCTDFALDVFNAAGGNLTIPQHVIPGFEVDGGSNTPQGLFEKIQSMNQNGTANTTTTDGKSYAGSSKGPCD